MRERKTLTCINCSHQWQPRKTFGYCPHCKTTKQPKGNAPEPVTCKRCEHSWIPRTKTVPDQCPKCSSTKWHEKQLPEIQTKEKPPRDDYTHEDFAELIFSPEYD